LDYFNIKLGVTKCAYSTNAEDKASLWYKHSQLPTLDQNEPYKYLGIWISLSLNWDYHLEYMLEKFDAKIKKIKSLPVAAEAKTAILNATALAMVGYTMQVMKIPKSLLDRINLAVTELFTAWAHIPRTMPKSLLFLSKSKGGCGLLDMHDLQAQRYISSALKCFFNSPNPIINHIAQVVIEESLHGERIHRIQTSKLRNWDTPSPNCTHGVYPMNWLLSLAPKDLELHDTHKKMSTSEFLVLVQGVPKHFTQNSTGRKLIFTDGGETDNTPTAAVVFGEIEQQNIKILLPQFYADSFSKELIAILTAIAKTTPENHCTIITDSMSILRTKRNKVHSNNAHPWLTALLPKLPTNAMLYIPSHQSQKLAANKEKWQRTFSSLKIKYGVDFSLYSHGNMLADSLASRLDSNVTHSLVGFGSKVLAPEYVNLIPLSSNAVWDGKVTKRIRESQQECKLQEIESLPKMGNAWRLMKQKGRNLKILFSAALSNSPILQKLASFQRRAIINMLPTPSQMSYRDLSTLSKNRREAYSKPTCPFCPGELRANLGHIILECNLTKHLRNLRRCQVKHIIKEYAAKSGKKINPKIFAWFDDDPCPQCSSLQDDQLPKLLGALGYLPLKFGSWAKATGIKGKYLWHLKKDLTMCIIYWTWVSFKIFMHEFAKFHHFEKSKWSCITDALPTLSNCLQNHRGQTTTHKRTLKAKIGRRRTSIPPLSRKNSHDNPEFTQWGWRNVVPEISHTLCQKRPRLGPLDTWLTKEVSALMS
jgi:hypothetical protein